MKCPLCKHELNQTRNSFECINKCCLLYSFTLYGWWWEKMQREIDTLTAQAASAAAPRWRPFNLEEMRKSVPVIVSDPVRARNIFTLFLAEDVDRFDLWFEDHQKNRCVWLPVPKVEVVK